MLIEDNIPLPSEQRTSLPAMPPLPEAFTVKEAMDALKCGHSTLYRLFAQGELTPMKIGSKTLVLGLREFLERKAAEARQFRAAS